VRDGADCGTARAAPYRAAVNARRRNRKNQLNQKNQLNYPRPTVLDVENSVENAFK
jgi:hypothetical protein